MNFAKQLTCAVALIIFSSFYLFAQTDAIYQTKEVYFKNADIKLAASLLLPESDGNLPAVIIIHGSGTSSRQNSWTTAHAEALARRGIVVLYPDKRGSGQSEGDWRTVGFETLADDAVARVNFLASHPKVDPERIVLVGFSQGGHIAPLATKRAPFAASVISISASVVPLKEQILDEVKIAAEMEGLSPSEVQKVDAINQKAVVYGATGKGWESYISAIKNIKPARLRETDSVKGFPTEQNHWVWNWSKIVIDYDPLPYWRELDVPMLFIYGGRDRNVRTQKSIQIIQETLSSLDKNFSILFFGANGHGVFREDQLDFMARWIFDKGSK